MPALVLGRERWTELNVGPFYLDSAGDASGARDVLTQFEQVRWVLGGLLEIQDLRSLWPIRVVFDPKASSGGQLTERNGEYLFVCRPGFHPPLDQIAGLLLDSNTPRLPEEAEAGLRGLFGTLEAHGSRVSWGGPVPHPTLALARMQLFATRFEYRASLHVLVASLKSGSTLPVAERNAFGKDPAVLEKEAEQNLKDGNWQAVSVSGRPLDPKRDFGEHLIDADVIDCYRADALLETDPAAAEALYKAAIESGGPGKPLGFAGLVEIARVRHQDPKPDLQNAVNAGLISATVDTALAAEEPPAQATMLLKRAAALNPLWAVPVYKQALLAADPLEKEKLLQSAARIDRRATSYWIELAQVQTSNGHAIEAQASWLRAEDSAPTQEERDHIRQMRMEAEQARLDAADAERLRQREAAHEDDQRAQSNEAEAIRSAEDKANRENDLASGGSKPETVVPWDATLPRRKLIGLLTQVECLHGGRARITVKDRAGKPTVLLGEASAVTAVSCGPQQPARRVSLSYSVDPDDRLRTVGRIIELQLQ